MYTAAQLLSGESPGKPLKDLVARVAPTPLLLIATGGSLPVERDYKRIYLRAAREPVGFWELPDVDHTAAIRQRPAEYERRVVGLLDAALLDRAGNGLDAGSIPGSKLSATEANRGQLKTAQRAEVGVTASGSLRLGAGRSQVQILSPRCEGPAKRDQHRSGAMDGVRFGVQIDATSRKWSITGQRRFSEPVTTRSFAPRRSIAPRVAVRPGPSCRRRVGARRFSRRLR